MQCSFMTLMLTFFCDIFPLFCALTLDSVLVCKTHGIELRIIPLLTTNLNKFQVESPVSTRYPLPMLG